jgi:hypothetical protein
MRDIGYTLETALADVVDNSISAGAKTVNVLVDAHGIEPKIGVLDDGSGMTSEELVDAMRLGSRNPHEPRARRDLGRFGLGMKTASFSQCRRLSVLTRRGSKVSAAVWDLDHVAEVDSWALQLPPDPSVIPFAERLVQNGSLIVWEKLDRAVEPGGGVNTTRNFIARVDDARAHLQLVFHRFLSGELGERRVQILLNELPLRPTDPFHASHAATDRGTTERIKIGDDFVEITPFTLPHHRNVTRAEWEAFAGAGGYTRSQGFYLYRERRLIVHGTWFGLARQTELTKLTRVRIDIPNTLDEQWHVDVKKASARPPVQVRDRLRNLIQEIGAPSRRVYTRRGVRVTDATLPLWQRAQEDNRIAYRLNTDSPAIVAFEAKLPEGLRREFLQLLAVISAGLPMDGIFADLATSPESVENHHLDEQTLRTHLETTWRGLADHGFDAALIPDLLRAVEPFRSHWERTESLLETIRPEGYA